MVLFSGRRWFIAPLAIGLAFSILIGRVAIANTSSELVRLLQPISISVNESFISPLVELFGDVSVGRVYRVWRSH